MKKLSVLIILLSIVFIGSSQIVSENKEYVFVDSLDLTKDEIYLKTKYYIANKWVSANDVIQLDDKENGIILIKAKKDIKLYAAISYTYNYTFDYTIEFRMKDDKFKITIKNINNSKAYYSARGQSIGKIFLSYNSKENCPGPFIINAPKNAVIEEMKKLDKYFEDLLIDCKNAITSNDNIIDDF